MVIRGVGYAPPPIHLQLTINAAMGMVCVCVCVGGKGVMEAITHLPRNANRRKVATWPRNFIERYIVLIFDFPI